MNRVLHNCRVMGRDVAVCDPWPLSHVLQSAHLWHHRQDAPQQLPAGLAHVWEAVAAADYQLAFSAFDMLYTTGTTVGWHEQVLDIIRPHYRAVEPQP